MSRNHGYSWRNRTGNPVAEVASRERDRRMSRGEVVDPPQHVTAQRPTTAWEPWERDTTTFTPAGGEVRGEERLRWQEAWDRMTTNPLMETVVNRAVEDMAEVELRRAAAQIEASRRADMERRNVAQDFEGFLRSNRGPRRQAEVQIPSPRQEAPIAHQIDPFYQYDQGETLFVGYNLDRLRNIVHSIDDSDARDTCAKFLSMITLLDSHMRVMGVRMKKLEDTIDLLVNGDE